MMPSLLLLLLLPLPLLVAAVGNGSSPPFSNNYRVHVKVRATSGRTPIAFTCSSSTATIATAVAFGYSDTAGISCGGISCGGSPTSCASINATYVLAVPASGCKWNMDGPCKALPSVHSGSCMHGLQEFTSVSEALTTQLAASLMNNCSDTKRKEIVWASSLDNPADRDRLGSPAIVT